MLVLLSYCSVFILSSCSQFVNNRPVQYPAFFAASDPVDARFLVLESHLAQTLKDVAALQRQVVQLQEIMLIDWQKDDNGTAYKIFKTAKTWDDAAALCKMYNAELGAIEDDQQNDFVKGMMSLEPNLSIDSFWIGTRTRAEIAHRAAKYTNFRVDDKITGCTMMTSDGQWYVHECEKSLPFLCIRSSKLS